MEVHLTPELQAKVDRWTEQTGRSPHELVEDAMNGYFEEITRVRIGLDNRYDDVKSGKTKLIDGEVALETLRRKSDARRRSTE